MFILFEIVLVVTNTGEAASCGRALLFKAGVTVELRTPVIFSRRCVACTLRQIWRKCETASCWFNVLKCLSKFRKVVFEICVAQHLNQTWAVLCSGMVYFISILSRDLRCQSGMPRLDVNVQIGGHIRFQLSCIVCRNVHRDRSWTLHVYTLLLQFETCCCEYHLLECLSCFSAALFESKLSKRVWYRVGCFQCIHWHRIKSDGGRIRCWVNCMPDPPLSVFAPNRLR